MYRRGLQGFGDCYSDVQARINAGYVFKGSNLYFTCKANQPLSNLLWQQALQAIQADLSNAGYYNVAVSGSADGSGFTGWVNIQISLNPVNDLGQLDHVKQTAIAVIRHYWNNVYETQISVRAIPNICGGGAPAPAPGTGTGGGATQPPPDTMGGGSGGDWGALGGFLKTPLGIGALLIVGYMVLTTR